MGPYKINTWAPDVQHQSSNSWTLLEKYQFDKSKTTFFAQCYDSRTASLYYL